MGVLSCCTHSVSCCTYTLKWKLLSSDFPVVLFVVAVLGGSNFWDCGLNPKVWPFKRKLPLSSTFYYVVQRDPSFWVCGWNPMVKRNSFGSTSTWSFFLFSNLQNKIDKFLLHFKSNTGYHSSLLHVWKWEQKSAMKVREVAVEHGCTVDLSSTPQLNNNNVGGVSQDLVLLHSVDVFYVPIGDAETRD